MSISVYVRTAGTVSSDTANCESYVVSGVHLLLISSLSEASSSF